MDSTRDVNGNRIDVGYVAGRMTTLSHSSGASLAFTYNAAGLIASVADSSGRTTNYGYDPTNNVLVNVTSPDGTTTYDYYTGGARDGALRSETDPSGVTRFYDYDDLGRLAATYLAGII
ncbi:MAG: hypothetical protein ACK53L_03010, partial [Pirellulaceae bacterium]